MEHANIPEQDLTNPFTFNGIEYVKHPTNGDIDRIATQEETAGFKVLIVNTGEYKCLYVAYNY